MSQQALLRRATSTEVLEPVLIATDDRGVATISINRQERHNAFDNHLVAQLTDCFNECASNSEVRVLVLTGTGKSFSSGADLDWMRSMASYTHQENREDATRLAGMMAALVAIPQPTVARINGAAIGGGVGLVCCCDLAIASSRAKFALTEVRLGLAPAVISPYVIAAIGVRQCQRYFQTGEIINADQAVRLGLVHEAVEHEYLDSAIERQIRLLLKGGPNAQAANKRLIEKAKREKCAVSMSGYTAELIAELRVSPEGQEGLSAFLEKREPSFQWK
ncbi:MAG: enoyl-CoA hydratase-related protein [Woeseia sp.]